MKTDYSEEIKNLIDRNYKPVTSLLDVDDHTDKKNLEDLHKEITNILPSKWVQEADVYEALSELKFESFMYTFKAVEDKKGRVIVPERQEMLYLLERKTTAL